MQVVFQAIRKSNFNPTFDGPTLKVELVGWLYPSSRLQISLTFTPQVLKSNRRHVNM